MGEDVRDPRRLLDESAMSRAQIVAVSIVCALSALDGYDVLALSFAAPGISQTWGIGKAALGVALSSGLVGMAIGSVALAPLADLYGRRRLVFVSLVLMAVGMLFSAFAPSLLILAAWRVVTGIGIGAMVPIATPLAVEFANRRRRALAMALFAIGFPLGGTVGGFGAALLLRNFAWPSVFLLGAALSLVMLVLAFLYLPEPLAFLLQRRDPRSLEQVNALLARCGQSAIGALPARQERTSAPWRALFETGQRARTVRITFVNLLYVMAVYYVLSWMPQLVADQGFSASAGTAISAVATLSGAVVCIAVSLAAPNLRLRLLAIAMMAGLGLATMCFGFTPADLTLLAIMAALVGAFLFTGIFGLYSTIVDAFEPDLRATGAGFVMGVGRGGSALGPVVAGGLLSMGVGRGTVAIVFGLLALGAAALLSGREVRA